MSEDLRVDRVSARILDKMSLSISLFIIVSNFPIFLIFFCLNKFKNVKNDAGFTCIWMSACMINSDQIGFLYAIFELNLWECLKFIYLSQIGWIS